MADRYSPTRLEEACKTALSYTQSPSVYCIIKVPKVAETIPFGKCLCNFRELSLAKNSPSYKSVSNILAASKKNASEGEGKNSDTHKSSANGITRGADYYRRKRS